MIFLLLFLTQTTFKGGMMRFFAIQGM
jgi:hypothetical protein